MKQDDGYLFYNHRHMAYLLSQYFHQLQAFLLERFYRVMEQGFLVDPLTLPSHTEYYTWVALREKFPCRRLTLGEVCKLLREEGYTDSKGILKSKEGEDQPT